MPQKNVTGKKCYPEERISTVQNDINLFHLSVLIEDRRSQWAKMPFQEASRGTYVPLTQAQLEKTTQKSPHRGQSDVFPD